jgi:hypothetical protein
VLATIPAFEEMMAGRVRPRGRRSRPASERDWREAARWLEPNEFERWGVARQKSDVSFSAISTATPASAIITSVTELGSPVCLRDTDTADDLGICHALPPVEPGDLVSLERGDPLRLVAVIEPWPNAKAVPCARPA